MIFTDAKCLLLFQQLEVDFIFNYLCMIWYHILQGHLMFMDIRAWQ